ncbi:uncharacterized protein [Musca autumnalis]|uniref:uncharacterized protein n=1 Tax=Musca autumnalis TaxID=221902 RepID=UPI003CEDEDCC
MITKTPDYMISEYGYPELWTSESKHIPLSKVNSKFWNSYSNWCNNKSTTTFAKLLPLRESWTDYYTKNLIKQNEESAAKKYQRLPSVQKQQKNHYNEVLVTKNNNNKNKSFHCKSLRRSLDAENTVATTMESQRRSRTKPLDNDVDQF